MSDWLGGVVRSLVLMTLVSGAGCAPDSNGDLRLGACSDPRLTEASCGTLHVWLDPEAAGGRRIELRLTVLHALGERLTEERVTEERIEEDKAPLFYLAGGPGVAATGVAVGWNESPLRRQRDLVFVDQRGTGGSHPLHCPLLGLQEAVDFVLFTRLPAAGDCALRLAHEADLSLFTTRQAADDLDAVRRALGYEQIDLLGASYGSHTAQVYLRRYPEQVHAAILRGVVLPNSHLSHQLDGTLDALEALFDDCRSDAACAAVVPQPAAALDTVRQRLRQQPEVLAVTDPRTGQPAWLEVEEDHLLELIRLLLYDARAARFLPADLATAADGDLLPLVTRGVSLAASALPHFAAGLLMNVVCLEGVGLDGMTSGATLESLRRPGDAPPSALGSRLEAARRGCAEWRKAVDVEASTSGTPSHAGPFSTPVLALSGAIDPATPATGVDALLQSWPRHRHVVLPAVGHAPLAPGCVEDLLLAFLDHPDPKSLDTTCIQNLRRPPFAVPAAS